MLNTSCPENMPASRRENWCFCGQNYKELWFDRRRRIDRERVYSVMVCISFSWAKPAEIVSSVSLAVLGCKVLCASSCELQRIWAGLFDSPWASVNSFLFSYFQIYSWITIYLQSILNSNANVTRVIFIILGRIMDLFITYRWKMNLFINTQNLGAQMLLSNFDQWPYVQPPSELLASVNVAK